MGAYLVPNARSISEVYDYAVPAGGSTLSLVDNGVIVTDPTRTDAALAALYAGYAPAAASDADYRPKLDAAIALHAGHLVALHDAVRAGQTPTNAQVLHVIADIIDWIRLAEPRL